MTKRRMERSTKNAFAALGGDFRFSTTPGGGIPARVNDGCRFALRKPLQLELQCEAQRRKLEDGGLKKMTDTGSMAGGER